MKCVCGTPLKGGNDFCDKCAAEKAEAREAEQDFKDKVLAVIRDSLRIDVTRRNPYSDTFYVKLLLDGELLSEDSITVPS